MNRAENVEVFYLYRDGGNFKNFGSVVFSNHGNIDSESLLASISEALVDGVFFETRLAGVPSLFFDQFPFDPDLDHEWHEFERLQITPKAVTDKDQRDVGHFIAQMREVRKRRAA